MPQTPVVLREADNFLLVEARPATEAGELARISRAPCKGTVFQRVRTPPGNFRSSR